MRMKVFIGTYFKIEEDFNNFFRPLKNVYINDLEWKNDIGTDRHVLVVIYATDN